MKRLAWVSRDAWLLLGAQGLRSFAFSFLAILLPIYLSLLGYDAVVVGVVLAAMILGSALQTAVMGFMADRMGRKRALILLSLQTSLAGAIYTTSDALLLILVATLLAGAGGPGAGVPGGGPYLAVHSALIAEKVSDERRNALFALSTALASLGSAGGALFSALPDLLGLLGLSSLEGAKVALAFFTLTALATLAMLLPVREVHRREERHLWPRRSSWLAKRLALIGALDGFGTGFIINPVVAYWFYVRFGVGLSGLGSFFFLFSIVSTITYYIAIRLAHRFGSVNTIFFSHAPSVLLLLAVPFAPSFSVAAGLMLVRPLISHIDVPLRQSYMMALAHPEERASVAGIAGVSKTVTSGISPAMAGYAMQQLSLAAPFFAGGLFLLLADGLFYLSFRRLKPPEEVYRSRSGQTTS